MIKYLLLLVALFLIGLRAISQNTFGLKAGMNWAHQTNISTSTIFPHSTKQTESLPGYQFGFFYKAKISRKLTFSTEANFSVVGARDWYMYVTSTDSTIAYGHVNDKIGYMQVPLMLQYNLNRFYISAGPAISLKLFSKSPLSLYYKTFDVAANLLGGYHVSKKWDVNLGYSYGLTDVNKTSEIAMRKKNKYFNLSLLYALK